MSAKDAVVWMSWSKRRAYGTLAGAGAALVAVTATVAVAIGGSGPVAAPPAATATISVTVEPTTGVDPGPGTEALTTSIPGFTPPTLDPAVAGPALAVVRAWIDHDPNLAGLAHPTLLAKVVGPDGWPPVDMVVTGTPEIVEAVETTAAVLVPTNLGDVTVTLVHVDEGPDPWIVMDLAL